MSKKIESWKWRIYKAKLTQDQFCQRFDIAPGQLSDWLNGRKKPKQVSVDKIESYLKELGV